MQPSFMTLTELAYCSTIIASIKPKDILTYNELKERVERRYRKWEEDFSEENFRIILADMTEKGGWFEHLPELGLYAVTEKRHEIRIWSKVYRDCTRAMKDTGTTPGKMDRKLGHTRLV